jgi:retron-type reverse transcriptase
MSRLATLKAAKSLSELSEILAFKPKAVSFILYKQPAAAKYRTFQIPKRRGGQRTISAPIDALKVLQRKLADLLQDCVDEINEKRRRKDRVAHGFKRRRSIITNARQHRHRRWVFNLDLEDFFPSINFGRVRGYLIKNRDLELHEDVATVIAQIACHENALPQGSPCSPAISNLVAHVLDMHLVKLASSAGCTYTRYADDLTFSTNEKEFPAEIAVRSATEGAGAHEWVLGEKLQKIIQTAGFRVNVKKTHMMYRSSCQEVTGIVVNEKINVRWRYRHNVRAMVHKLVTTGAFDVVGVAQTDGQAVVETRAGTLNELHGMLGFIDSVVQSNPQSANAPRGMSSEERVYREFLIYKDFYATQVPVVICEGETDNVYLTHAIRGLANEFPDLAEVTNKKIRLKVRLYKYPHSSTARLLGLRGGGSSALSKLIAVYKNETSRFTAPGLTNPVIIVYDNDDGAGNIRNAIKQASRLRPTGAEPFLHVVKNLYAVPTPLLQGATESKIEDFFPPAVKATRIDGKTFNDGNSVQIDSQYGKKIFAHKVVQPNAGTIDFAGFRPLLNNLTAAINAHWRSALPRQAGR